MLHCEEILEIIEEVIEIEMDEKDYSINPFNYGLDSLGVLKLVTILEDRLNIEIDDNDLTIENMSSINSIINMVKKYVS